MRSFEQGQAVHYSSRLHERDSHQSWRPQDELRDIAAGAAGASEAGLVQRHLSLSSLKFVWVMVRCMEIFAQIDKRLSEIKNPLYLRAYMDASAWSRKKRMGLTYLVFQLDDETMRIMASAFENPPALFLQHVYWEEFGGLGEPDMYFFERGGDDPYDTCSIM